MTLLLTLDDGSVQRKLADAVEFARAAVLEDAPEEQLGAHVGVTREDAVTASHLFEAQVPGYGGWRWSVTVALAGDDEPVTVSEVVLVPGPSALVAPPWVPWERRVRAGDLGVGDIFPTDENDPRLAPAYLQSDDPAVEEVSREAGLGRVHVLSRFGRTEAAARWHEGEFGPRSDMARSAPDVCGTCGFFVPLAGSLRGVFGVCSNDIAPADGHVVDVEYGCGAHSEVEVEVTSSIPVAELVYDDSLLDYAPAPEVVETAAAEPETAVAEADVSPAEVEPEVAAAEPAAEVEPEPVVAEAAVEAEPELAEAEPAQPVAAVEAEPAVVEAEPESAQVESGVSAELAVAEAEPEARESAQAEPAEAAAESAEAEPVVAQAESAVEPESAQAESAESGAVIDPAAAVAEPVVAEAPAATDEAVEPSEAAASVAEPIGTAEAPEPVAPETDPAAAVAEAPAVTDDVAEPSDAPEAAVEPAEAADEAREPVVADVPEPAEAEPTQAEVTDAVAAVGAGQAPAEPEAAAEVPLAAESDAAEVDPVPAVAAEPESQEAELPEAVLTDDVVTQASQPDEAQAQVDDASER